DAEDGRLSLVLDPLFAVGRAAPVGAEKTALLVQIPLELLVILRLARVLTQERPSLVEHVLLNLLEKGRDARRQGRARHRDLPAIETAHRHELVLLQVLGA